MASQNGASLPPDSSAQLSGIARQDEAKGAAVHSFDPDASPQEKAAAAGKARSQLGPVRKDDSPGGKEVAIDTGPSSVLPTITIQDVDKESPEDPSSPQAPSPPGGIDASSPAIPDWYKVGWRAVGGIDNPELEGEQKDHSVLAAFLHEQYYGEWYFNAALIFFAVFSSHFLTRFNLGWGWLFIVLAICNTYYSTSMARVRRRARDDIQRELVKTSLASEHESAEWLNNFFERFWGIYEPVLSATIVASVDQILSTNCPPFLDSLRLSTFTLGNKSFRIDKVRTFPKTDDDIVMMDWGVSFTPNDVSDMTPKQAAKKVNPKIVLSIRLGKGLATAAMPVLLEDLSFSGLMRIRLKLMTNFPHVQLVDISFLEKPVFDYSLKPVGGETFGFDVGNIPGLSSFIREMVHATLGPMMYDPNVFTLNLEQLLSGAPLDTAIGVLQVTVHSARGIKGTKITGGTPDPYISLSYNNRAELAKTKYKHNTYNPTWMETKFLLVNSLSESLVLSLYDYNDHRTNTLMGAATFELAELMDDATQEGLTRNLLKDGKERGELKFDVSFYPVLSPKGESGVEEIPDTNVGIVRLVVHQAKDLDNTKSMSGDLNPFVKVFLGDQPSPTQVSTKIKHTNNPVWETPAEFLCADKSSSIITLKVIDDRDFLKDPVVGYMSVRLEDLLKAKEEAGKDWWPLSGCKSGRIRLSTEWKPLDMAGSLHGADQYVAPIGVVRLLLHKATDVKNVEATLGGKSDPYVRVQVNNVTLGRTEVVNNNLSPVWDQIIYVPVHSLKESLFLECMDYQHLTKDRSLGSVELHLNELATTSDSHEYPYTSTGKKVGADPIRLDKGNVFKGQLHYEAEFIPALDLQGVKFESEGNQMQRAAAGGSDSGSFADDDGSSMSSSDIEVQAVPTGITATAPMGVDKRGVHHHSKGKSTDTTGTAGTTATANNTDATDSAPASPISVNDVVSPANGNGNGKDDPEKGVVLSKDELLHQQSGIVVFNIIGGHLTKKARLEVLLDDGYWPAFTTTMARSTTASWDYIGEGFIKELDFGRVWLRLNEASEGDKDDIIGEWKEDAKKFLMEALDGPTTRTLTDEDGKIMGTIQLEARFVPVPVKLEPRESVNNQGLLRVKLIDGREITGADRSGKSDPFAVFTLNGQKVFKSQVKKKTLTPEWNEEFVVSVPSRVGAEFELEIFDWNQLEQAKSLGTGQINLETVEPFQGTEHIVALSSPKHGDKGHIRLQLNFEPSIIAKSRKNTSTFSAAGRAMTQIGSLPVGAGKGVFHGVAGVFERGNNSEEDVDPVPTNLPSGQSSQPVGADGVAGGASFPAMNNVSQPDGTSSAEPGTLRVTVLEGKDFNPSGDSVKPYVVLRCGDKEHKTKHAPKTSTADCSWGESFNFTAGPATQPKIFVWINDHKSLAKDKQLGSGEIDIWRHIQSTALSSADVTVELREGQGLVKIRLEYDPNGHPLTRAASHVSSERGVIGSPSRFSIRTRRPGTVNDE